MLIYVKTAAKSGGIAKKTENVERSIYARNAALGHIILVTTRSEKLTKINATSSAPSLLPSPVPRHELTIPAAKPDENPRRPARR
jgi:hypothetical protein